jgi:hypothetical protein
MAVETNSTGNYAFKMCVHYDVLFKAEMSVHFTVVCYTLMMTWQHHKVNCNCSSVNNKAIEHCTDMPLL